MTLKNINEEIGVIKAHLEQDQPDVEFIVRHAETLLFMAHELAETGCAAVSGEGHPYLDSR
jgi:hypothetical protein